MADHLYIHVPFCVRKCVYCDFLSIAFDKDLAGRYVDALCNELALKKDSAGTLKTIYIGGGTPTILDNASCSRLFACIDDNYSISPTAEITVEANPGTIGGSKTEALLSLGVNRISMGVQSFNDMELKTLGRIHSGGEAVNSAALIKEAGVGNFSLDLMYGIPGQTIDTWSVTLEKTMEIAPSHVSAYELTPEEETPFFGLLKRGEIILPDEGLVLEMHDFAVDYLYSNGFEYYEISNFARPGYKCLHNMNYWNRGEYLAAGAGAHSFLDGIRSRNTGNIRLYVEKLMTGNLPEDESSRVTAAEASRERLFLGLRKKEGVSISDPELEGIDLTAAAKDLIDKGYLESAGGYLRLTGKGVALSNTVIAELFLKLGL